MCGIAGFIDKKNAKADTTVVKKMCAAMAHRGPDDEGYFQDGHIALGHKRLAIVDMSEKGHQPMSNEDKTLWMTFNGEIYNFKEIKEDLIKKGHHFRSQTDCEVILHGFEEYGVEILQKLNGIFAFALLNTKNHEILLARDPLGVKPLYYYENEKLFLFASELKGLLASKIIPKNVEVEAIYHYLSIQAVPPPLTMIQNVYSLMPGEYAIIRDKKMQKHQYHSLDIQCNYEFGHKKEPYIQKTKELIEKAVKKQQMSDVPVAAMLSGGIDSSSIVGIMSQENSQVNTFTLGTDTEEDMGEFYDEREMAKISADYYSCNHSEHILHQEDILAKLKPIIISMDQPSGRSIISYFIFESVQNKYKVLFSGSGGDELFSGYTTKEIFEKVNRFKWLDNMFHPFFKTINNTLIRPFSLFQQSCVALDVLEAQNTYEKCIALNWIYKDKEKQDLFSSPVQQYNSQDFFHNFAKPNSKSHDKIIECFDYICLLYEQIPQLDSMSMSHSIEARVPLLDLDLVRYANSIPASIKHPKGVKSKHLFREAMKDILPSEIYEGKKKGFATPFEKYIRDLLFPTVEDCFSSLKKRGIFQEKALDNIFHEYFHHTYNPWKDYLKIWLLVTLELWMQSFIDEQ